ncbi:nanos-like protein [Saccoglossus kowalevskii]|uniref:Nanos-like protein n=1 Tax=Saccoglossus kowalevskii TaxID=10224 RepID=D1LX73_SACKO|nr:nanos-like protein [Saccoglossus kowalevskii]ACY92579.1 nanos-like protein [Saccoglossus kowalevskii]
MMRSQFQPLKDYLGLANLVGNIRELQNSQHLSSPEDFDVDKFFFPPVPRGRFDSMGSSSSSSASDFSLNGTDRDIDCCSSYNFSDFPVARNLSPLDFLMNGTDFDYTPPYGFSDFEVNRLHSPLDLCSGRNSLAINRRGKQSRKKAQQVCVFCRNNGESESVYADHALKDSEGKVTCPVLRRYTCPICGANGDEAHTIKYCPHGNKNDEQPSMKMLKATRTSTGKKRSI